MVEVQSFFDDVGMAYDLCMSRNIPLSMTLGAPCQRSDGVVFLRAHTERV